MMDSLGVFLLLVAITIHGIQFKFVTAERNVECEYGVDGYNVRDQYKYCAVEFLELVEPRENFKFSGTEEEKGEVTTVRFKYSSSAQSLPVEIFEQFPQVNGLEIVDSTVPNIPDTLFTQQFQPLQFLEVTFCDTKSIAEGAFRQLPNLKLINLSWNKLETLPTAIFAGNQQLEKVILWNNKIRSLNPEIFSNLPQLKFVNLFKNPCIDDSFGCTWCKKLDTLGNRLKASCPVSST